MVWLSSKMKRYFMPVFVLAFLTLGRFCAFAMTCPATGAMNFSPFDYALSCALMMNGVNPYQDMQFWRRGYVLNAQYENDVEALALIDELNSLEWNGVFENQQLLYENVREWLCSIGYSGNPGCYEIPVASMPDQEWVWDSNFNAFQATPLEIDAADIVTVPSGYSYSFSMHYSMQYPRGSFRLVKRNTYLPTGITVAGLFKHYGGDVGEIQLYTFDNGEITGVDAVMEHSCYNIETHSRIDDSSWCNSRSHSSTYEYLSKLPFPVFEDENELSNYLSGGQASGVINDGYTMRVQQSYPDVFNHSFGTIERLAFPDSMNTVKTKIDALVSSMPGVSQESMFSVFGDFGVSYVRSYTINYYYDGVLKSTETVPLYLDNNVVSEVPVSEDGFYKLGDAPYDPPLPFAVDAQHNSISVRYVSRAADSVVKGATGAVSGIGRFLVSILPYALVIVGIVLFTILSIRLYKRLVNKA